MLLPILFLLLNYARNFLYWLVYANTITYNNKNITIHFPASGVYFVYYLGVLQYLKDNYDLSNIQYSGTSSGSLVAIIARYNLDYNKIITRCKELQLEIYKRGGILFIFREYIQLVYDEFIPDLLYYDKIQIVITQCKLSLIPFKRCILTNFTSKKDVIHALHASQHIPYILDKHLFYKNNDKYYLDGYVSELFCKNIHSIELPLVDLSNKCISLLTDDEINNLFSSGYNNAMKKQLYYDTILPRIIK